MRDFFPHLKKQDQCFEDEQTEVIDSLHKRKILGKDGKPLLKAFPHDKSVAQLSYEEFLKEILNPETNEYYPARNKAGNEIKGTGAKHIVNQIIRLRRVVISEVESAIGRSMGYDDNQFTT